jgi:SAM-dependent methyltransferase
MFGYSKLYFFLSRFLTMRGYNIPFRKDHRKYWQTRNTGDDHGPQRYTEEDHSTYVLFADLLRVLGKDASFLEVGCNAGRNLNFLLNAGYRNLAGIEINETSINETLRCHFPQLYDTALFYIGNAADEIKKIEDNRYDVVFSIAVLEHIPPEDMSLFRDMVRVSKKYIAVITGENSKVYPYDFHKVFERAGCKTVQFRLFYGENHNFELPKQPYIEKDHLFDAMFLRIFIKNQ